VAVTAEGRKMERSVAGVVVVAEWSTGWSVAGVARLI